MGELSVKGVIRRYALVSSPQQLSLRNHLLIPIFGETGGRSVRTKSESLARTEMEYDLEEDCKEKSFYTESAWEQTWTHIRVRIKLYWDDESATFYGLPLFSEQEKENLRNTWKNGIEVTWNKKWGCRRDSEGTCRFTFEVRWVNSNEHHVVAVSRCRFSSIPLPFRSFLCRENSGHFYDTTSGSIASHEFGHLIGLKDEYSDPKQCSDRVPVNTGTVMDQNSPCIPPRLMWEFANRLEQASIKAEVVAIPEYTYNSSTCI